MIDKTQIFLRIAKEIASQSHCVSHKVGAVIVRDGRILSTGYNGTPPGFINCDDRFRGYVPEKHREAHHHFSDRFEIHAEENAIIWAARNGISIDGASLYVTHSPCHGCLKKLCAAGITSVFYALPYDLSQYDAETLDMCANSNLLVQYCPETECEACKI